MPKAKAKKIKFKTRKSVAKRVKITARGKVKRWRPMRGHLKSRKSPSRIRGLRKTRLIEGPFAKSAKVLLGIG